MEEQRLRYSERSHKSLLTIINWLYGKPKEHRVDWLTKHKGLVAAVVVFVLIVAAYAVSKAA